VSAINGAHGAPCWDAINGAQHGEDLGREGKFNRKEGQGKARIDKIRAVLDFQGVEGFFCVIFDTICVIFDTLYTLDKTQNVSYNDTKPNKGVRT